jgi:hypothetical protein
LTIFIICCLQPTDVYSPLRFLNVEPFCDEEFFKQEVSDKINDGRPCGLSVCFLVDPWFNQASQVHRVKQERAVKVFRLVMQDSNEERLVKCKSLLEIEDGDLDVKMPAKKHTAAVRASNIGEGKEPAPRLRRTIQRSDEEEEEVEEDAKVPFRRAVSSDATAVLPPPPPENPIDPTRFEPVGGQAADGSTMQGGYYSLLSDQQPQSNDIIRHANAAAYFAKYATHVKELAYHVYADEEDGAVPPMLPPEHFDASMLPNTDDDSSPVTWSYEPTNRVVRVDFTQVAVHQPLPPRDLAQVALLMQRDDLVVITKGLTMELQSTGKVDTFLNYLAGGAQRQCHKFRRFQRRPNGPRNPYAYDEIDGHVAMTPVAFVSYLAHRKNGPADATVTFQLIDGTLATVGVHDVLLYMIDADVPKLYRKIEKLYKNEFRWSAVYPGGLLCMMKDLPSQMQPFMGPNLYVTPGNTYTSLHQDGLGTVDSGHSCLFGTNEVLMLRRMPEIHKRKLCAMVPSITKGVSAIDLSENTMYGLPHEDGRVDKQKWPTSQLVDQWRNMKYVTKQRENHLCSSGTHAFDHHSCYSQLLSVRLSLRSRRAFAH